MFLIIYHTGLSHLFIHFQVRHFFILIQEIWWAYVYIVTNSQTCSGVIELSHFSSQECWFKFFKSFYRSYFSGTNFLLSWLAWLFVLMYSFPCCVKQKKYCIKQRISICALQIVTKLMTFFFIHEISEVHKNDKCGSQQCLFCINDLMLNICLSK